jgi:streptomycin 6-kinase
VRLPEEFVRTVVAACDGEPGRVWLARLPALLAEVAAGWALSVGEPYELSFTYVTRVTRADGTPAVLKLCPPAYDEVRTEPAALRLAGGEGMVRLLDADPARGALLLERAEPRETLVRLHGTDDEAATRVAAEVGLRLHRPVPDAARPTFPTVEGWAARAFATLRERYAGGTGPLPAGVVERGEREHAELVASSAPAVLLHGDLHHGNVLSSARGWLAIDPKGVLGEPAYEVGALLRNPVGLGHRPDLRAVLDRRVPVLAEAYGVDRERVRGWGRAHNVVSLLWSHEDDDVVDTATLAVIEALSG